MEKNTAGKWIVFAFEDEGGTNPGEPVTGDAANITANVRIDGGAANAVDDTNPTELEDGYYIFDITAAESNGDLILIAPASSTANVNVIGVPGAVWTRPANFNDFSITATTGRVDVDSVGGTSQTANDNGADINTILSRIVGTLAAGTHNPASAAQIAVLSDWINGGRLDLLLDAIKAVTDAQAATGTGLTAIPWNAAWDAEVQSEVNDGLVAFFTSAAQLVDDIWDEPIAGHLTAGTSGLSEALGSAALVDGAITGAPTATVFTFTGGNVNDNFYNDQLVYILSGTGIGQVKPILSSAYSGGTTTITVDESFIVTPAAADRFAILVSHVHPNSQISAQIMADIDANGSTVIDELTTQGDTNETKLDTLTTQVGTAGAGLTDLGGMSTGMKAEILAEVIKVLTTQMTESYAADGVAPTPAQAFMLIQQLLSEFAISGTTITVKKLDGATTAATLTLDDGTNPTSATRAT